MRKSTQDMCDKLIMALQTRGILLTHTVKPFYNRDGKMVKMHVVNYVQHINGSYLYEEIFHTSSAVYLLFYLRDFWFIVTGRELPNDHGRWVNKREELAKKGDFLYGKHRDGNFQTVNRGD